MTKRIAILGSTGSIGSNALKVIEALGGEYEVTALSANTSVELLAEQCGRFAPGYAALTDGVGREKFMSLAEDCSAKLFFGPEGMEQLAALDEVDIVLAAVVGAAGLPAVLKAVESGKTVAVANKEPLVAAGKLLTETAAKTGAVILPVDSEHSAVFQCLQSGRKGEIRKIILTASGGPFRGASCEDLSRVTREQALAHPTWEMGPKITIDSATMMNKALEIIEAVWLFGVDASKIEVMVHPESIVHSMVEFEDGSIIAQLSTTDMCLPIQYALTYPERVPGIAQRLDLTKLGALTFEKPDREVFRALKLAYDVADRKGSAAVVFNAANEAAVELMLEDKIRFCNIVELVERCLDGHKDFEPASLDEILETDKITRKEVKECLNQTV